MPSLVSEPGSRHLGLRQAVQYYVRPFRGLGPLCVVVHLMMDVALATERQDGWLVAAYCTWSYPPLVYPSCPLILLLLRCTDLSRCFAESRRQAFYPLVRSVLIQLNEIECAI